MTIGHTSRGLLAAAGLALGVALAMPAVAQETTEQPAAEASSFSDNKLQSFAVAFLQVDQVRREYTPRVQEAESDEEKQQIQTEAGQMMMQAVEGAEGISVDEYNQIIESAQSDPEFAQKLNGVIGEAAEQQQ